MAYSSSQSQPRNWRKGFWNAVVYAMLIAGSLMFLLPLVFALTSSFKTNGQIMEIPPRWIPDPFHWQNYPEALDLYSFCEIYAEYAHHRSWCDHREPAFMYDHCVRICQVKSSREEFLFYPDAVHHDAGGTSPHHPDLHYLQQTRMG